MTQTQRVENTLQRAPDGVCSRFFIYDMEPGIPRVAARVCDLRDRGVPILTERCDLHYSTGRAHVKYRIDWEQAS